MTLASPISLYKKAYSGLSRNSWYLSIVMLINRSGTMVVPFMTIYAVQQLHFSIANAGYLMALFGLGAISGSFLGGRIADRFGFYDLQVGSLISGGLLFINLGFQHTFASVAASIFILSFCNESFRPANAIAIAQYSTGDNKTRSYSLNRLAANLGWAVGGALGGFLASVNYHLLFWVDGCSNIAAALMLLLLMPRAKVLKTITIKPKDGATQSAYKDGVYMVFILLSVFFGLCFFQFFIIQPVFFKTVWHFNERFIGFLMALNGILIAVVEMVMIHALEGRRHILTYITMGVLLAGAGFALLNLAPANALSAILIVVLITFGEMLSMPFMTTFWVTRTTDHNRGEYAGLNSMSWAASQVLSPAVGGQIIYHSGFKALWYTLAGLCLITAVGFRMIYRASHKSAR